ncbi:hypothetical protein AB6E89_12695 [Vibrio breoganii]
MKNVFSVALVALLGSTSLMAQDYNEVIDSVGERVSYELLSKEDATQGSGGNYTVGEAAYSANVIRASQATTVDSVERQNIIDESRGGTIAQATHSNTSYMASRLSDTERNYLINESAKVMCASIVGTTRSDSGNYCSSQDRVYWNATYRTDYTWAGSICNIVEVRTSYSEKSFSRDCAGTGGSGSDR